MLPGFETTEVDSPREVLEHKTPPHDELPVQFGEYLPQLTWHTAEFEAGDVVVFTERTVHASLTMGHDSKTSSARTNTRISIDTRWKVLGK